MSELLLVPLEDTVVFPGMTVTLTVDVGEEARVLLVPKHDGEYASVGTVAEVDERVRLRGGVRAVTLSGRHRGVIGVARTDEQGRLLAANEAACRLLGYELPELLALSPRSWEAAEPDLVAHLHERLSRPPAAVRATARLRRKDGAVVEIGYWASTTRVAGMDFVLTITDPVDEAVVVEPA